MENENIKDLGQWKVPSNWNEVTLKQFQDIQRLYSDKETSFDVRDVLHILTNHSKEEVNELPIEFTEKILSIVTFLQDEPTIGEPTNSIKVGKDTYTVNIQEKLTVGEYTAYSNIISSNETNFAGILAVLCRKEGEKYTLEFENEMVEQRMHMFEEVPMLDAMRVVSFFVEAYITYTMPTLLSSQIREAISLIRKDIETSRKNGDLSALSFLRLKTNLGKLEKSMRCI